MTSVLELDMDGTGEPHVYRVQVIRSPAGEASGNFHLEAAALIGQLDEFQQTLLASSVSRRRLLSRGESSVRRVGGELFETLFSPVDNVYRASSAVATERGEELQIVLRLNAPELAALPWECMFDVRDSSYVARRQPLVRSVPVSSAPPPLKVDLPLRILGLAASPRGLPLLDVDKEHENLQRAIQPLVNSGAAALRWLERTTWAGLQDALLSESWHIVHFVGHGGFDSARGEGVVAFEDGERRIHEVAGDNLVDLLREAQPMPRLVVLNACHSSTSDSGDSFSGLATTLVRGGVGAVTAMQFEVSDLAALEFGRGFYGALGHGRTVDEAVRSGRRAILGVNRDCLEWITPTLYLRGQETRLFALPGFTGHRSSSDVVEQHERALWAAEQDDPATAVLLFDNLLAENPNDEEARERRKEIVNSGSPRQHVVRDAVVRSDAVAGSEGENDSPDGANPMQGDVRQRAEGDGADSEPSERLPPARRRLRILMIVAGSIVIAALIAGIVLTFTQRGPTSSVLEGPAALPAGPALPSDQMVMTMVDDKNADLWVVKRGETTAARVRPLTSSPVADEFANLSPDRRTVIYRQSDTSNGTTVLRVVATNGTGDRPLFSDDPINCLSGIIRHAWNTADPTQLAVTCSKESGSAAYLVRTDGQIIRPLQLTDRDFGDPTFSPDGTRLAFWSANDFVAPGDPNGGIISVLNLADGEIRTKSSPSDAVDGDLAWSPTGELLAFTRYGLSGGADVVTINPDSGQIKSQTTSSALEALPSFSPNGRQIAYRSEERRESLPRGAGAKLWLLDLDTGNQDPMWQPTNLMNKYRHGRPAWTTR